MNLDVPLGEPLSVKADVPVLYGALGAILHLEPLRPEDADALSHVNELVWDWFGPALRWVYSSVEQEVVPASRDAADYIPGYPSQFVLPDDDDPQARWAEMAYTQFANDDFANEGREDLEAALQEAGTTYQINVYEGTQHAFHNDTGQRYNQEQAPVAWNDMLAWFEQYLVAGGDSATPMATPEG